MLATPSFVGLCSHSNSTSESLASICPLPNTKARTVVVSLAIACQARTHHLYNHSKSNILSFFKSAQLLDNFFVLFFSMAIDLDALLGAPNSVVDSEENDNLEAPPRPMMTMYEAMALIAVCVECDCEDIIADLAEAGAFVWPEPPLIPDERLNLDAITESDCILRFRFTARSIISIADMLGLPAIIITKHRYRVLGYEALAMILRRFAFPGRLYELVQEFGRSATAICRILIETSK